MIPTTPSQAPTSPNRVSVWTKLNTGSYALWRIFWLAWFLPIWIFSFILDVLDSIVLVGEVDVWFAWMFLGLILLFVVYFCVATFWAWRSANRHPGGWATAAKVWIGLNIASIPFGIVFYASVA